MAIAGPELELGVARRPELEQRVVLAPLELEACRHGVTAAFDEKSFMHGSPHHGAKVDRGDRAGRACRETVGIERSDEGRKAEALGDAAGDQSEQPLVPAFGAEPEEGTPRIERALGSHKGFRQHALLDRLALGVERFELCRDGARLALVVASKQLGAEG